MIVRAFCLLALTLTAACDQVPDFYATTWGGLYVDRPDMRPDYPDGRVAIEPDFRAFIADRRLDSPVGDWWVARSDGTIGGLTRDGRAITGTWYWSGSYFCRHIRFGGERTLNSDDCQVVVIEEDGILFTARRGHGDTDLYV